jgi:hypothetical protein
LIEHLVGLGIWRRVVEGIGENLERLRHLIWKYPLDFCLVYRIDRKRVSPELAPHTALGNVSEEEYRKLASYYLVVALDCLRRGRSHILKENMKGLGSEQKKWCGLTLSTGANRIPTPANSSGQRWWGVIVASGATVAAGFVIVARVGARDEKALKELIKGIQEIMGATG